MTRPILSIQERIGSIERRARRFPPVRGLMTITDTYNATGGGLLASGLAFSALFAVIPALLLLVSLLIIVAIDDGTKQRIIDWIITQLPPLAGVANDIVASVKDSARVGTVVGVVGFLWGASGFYLALDNALGRFFPSRRSRDPIRGRVRGIAAVLLLVAGVLAGFVTSTVVSSLTDLLGHDFDGIIALAIAILAASGVALACYRLVPIDPPYLRAAAPAALLAGVFIGSLTALFGVIAPWLVGGFAGLGAIASVFVALLWFGYVFQALLYGAAYARMLDVRIQAEELPPAV